MVTYEIIQMLYVRFANIWGDRFTARHTPDLLEMWYEDWLDGLQGLNPNTFRETLKYCKENLDWSPSIAEFIRICDRSLNIPSPQECIEAIKRRDFYHPMIKTIFEKINTWDFHNGTKEQVTKMITELHENEMIVFRRKRSLQAEPLKSIEGNSHGSELSRNNIGSNNMRKVEGYLF